VAISCLYALAGQDLFRDKVLDEVSSPFFSTYGVSLVTVFRMFVDGTLGIMYEASDTTTETARLYFISFAIFLAAFRATSAWYRGQHVHHGQTAQFVMRTVS